MKSLHTNHDDEQGYILVPALLILLILTIIGIAGNRNTSTELLIAGNDRTYKESFFNADSGIESAQELLEQNLACITGFPAKKDFVKDYSHLNGGAVIDNYAYINSKSLDMWRNFLPGKLIPSDSSRDILIPWDYTDTEPHTNIRLAGDTKLTTGAAIEMAAAYKGKGEGISAGGTFLFYKVKAQHLGKKNCQVKVAIQYRHIIGSEGDCYYR